MPAPLGMAVAGLDGRASSAGTSTGGSGILVSLCVLAVPTALLAVAPDLTTFAILRVVQGLCMASAFTLTLAYLGEECSAMDAGGAFAAYITGNVASNLIGRLVSAGVADHLGLAANFYFFSRAQSRRRGAGLFHHPLDRCRWCRRSGMLRRRFAVWTDASAQRAVAREPSASASASCSPSSARSPTSTSCWCASRCRSAG